MEGDDARSEGTAAMVDVVFDAVGKSLPVEHAFGLWRATVRWLPWFETEPRAGIHRLRAAPTGYGVVLLARRAKLALRVPEQRREDALSLAGKILDVGGNELAIGAGVARPLWPWATLHAQHVAAAAAGEVAFQDEVAAWLRARGVACQFITGRRRTLAAGGREIVGFSVVLHGVAPQASLAIQSDGMGTDRALGCGIFVPYKSIAAVA
jgi:CRISPR-associated protein Cas6